MLFSLARLAAQFPKASALIDQGRSVSYRELLELARQQLSQKSAAALADAAGATTRGLKILTASSDLSTVTQLLCWLDARQPLLLLHPRLTRPERARVVATFGQQRVPQSTLAVLLTSGTASNPKGVQLSRSACLAAIQASEANLGWRPDDRWLLSLPLAHVGGLGILLRCLLAGKPVVLPKPGSGLEVQRLTHAVEADRVTLLSLVPTQLERLLGLGWDPPATVRGILLGGAAAPVGLVARARRRGWPLLLTYGLTETWGQIATQPRPEATSTQGAPLLPGVEVRTVGGRIELRGKMLLDGYLPSSEHGSPWTSDGWFRSGDYGELLPGGRLLVHGRADDIIITGGENVHPGEVEPELERSPGVLEALVFSIPHQLWGQLVVAALRVSTDFRTDQLHQHIQEHLASHRRPRQIAVLEHFVCTSAGKRDRQRTAQLARPRLLAL